MDAEDNPAALIQIVSDKDGGRLAVSTWMTRYPEFENLQNMLAVFWEIPHHPAARPSLMAGAPGRYPCVGALLQTL